MTDTKPTDYKANRRRSPWTPEKFAAWYRIDAAGCWTWIGALNYGYGRVHHNGHWVRAHRYSWMLHRGEIPIGLVIDHLCRNRACVNPDHLRVVTQRENTLAEGSLSPAAFNAVKTHCKRGHAYDSVNTWRDKNGGRYCMPCIVEFNRRRRARLRNERSAVG